MDAPSPHKERLVALRELVDRLVTADMGPLSTPSPRPPRDGSARPCYTDCLHAKLDILDRALQALRQDVHHLENDLSLEWFLGSTWSVDSKEGIAFAADGRGESPPSAIPARAYQPLLLIFLLLYHEQFRAVAKIVGEFTERVWNQLGPRDFDRLHNGRTRCATNIGFAARDLRESLLLRSDREVMHKTWVLSFSGFLVAARLLEKYQPWQFAADEDLSGWRGRVLHHHVCNALYTPGGIVELAQWLFDRYGTPNVERHAVFGRVLRRAFDVALRHERSLRTPDLTRQQRLALGRHSLEEFLALPDYEQFLTEFSNYMMSSVTFRTARQRWGVS